MVRNAKISTLKAMSKAQLGKRVNQLRDEHNKTARKMGKLKFPYRDHPKTAKRLNNQIVKIGREMNKTTKALREKK